MSTDPRPFDNQPADGTAWKWWAVEVRFDRSLTRRQIRTMKEPGGGHAGADGAIWEQWPSKRPTADEDGAQLLRALAAVGVPGRWRAAPFGWRCPGDDCPHAHGEQGHRCVLGYVDACDPVWSDEDWHAFDFAAISSPTAPEPAGQGR